MGLSTFNRNRERIDEERRRGNVPAPRPGLTTEQALRVENDALRRELDTARGRVAELERELDAATAPEPPAEREPARDGAQAHRGRR